MLTVSLGLIAAALTVSTVALTIAITLDRRDQDQRMRSRGGAVDLSTTERQPTVVEWTHSFVLGNNGPDVSQPRPDIIIGPWGSTDVSIEDERRKAA